MKPDPGPDPTVPLFLEAHKGDPCVICGHPPKEPHALRVRAAGKVQYLVACRPCVENATPEQITAINKKFLEGV